ncbi:MAG: alpha-glucan family phosphorylase [Anaerolineae bacterium]|nr:alpha-glucan family phosphorylase [Anaerolineae bacterium]
MQAEPLLLSEKIPARIARLEELAYNFWWSWHRGSRDLFKMLDRTLWRSTGHNPVKMLREVPRDHLDEFAADPLFLRQYDAVLMALDADLNNGHLWFPSAYPDLTASPIAYFSAEFGLHRSLPIYSGGLGVLAGDHCKEASDIGLPLLAVGFLYEMGYFRQTLTSDGWQEAVYPVFETKEAAIREVMCDDEGKDCLFVPVEVGDREVQLQVWRVQAGRVNFYLMDAHHDLNKPWDQELTARLYGGDQEMRIQQEIVLGIGGMRVLRALGVDPAVYHLNEGHSSFLALERAREMVEAGKSFEEACQIISDTTHFTTHTPVPAGHDVFPFNLVERYFYNYWPRLGLGREEFMELGCANKDCNGFNMTVLALHMAGQSNGVSKLHGEVSRQMWQAVWPEKQVGEVPITYVTNGIHVPSWVGDAMNAIYRKHLGPDWIEQQDNLALWERIIDVPDEDLWAAHMHLKRKLMSLIRELARRARVERRDPEQVLTSGTLLDPEALVIGFARRFATYKRATLIFHDVDRLKRLLHNEYRPVQFIFAGKAHPADDGGKRLIQHIYNAARDPSMGGRIAFIEDYDMRVARYLVQGVDVWLNNPRRPHEASGTSGQKAAINGVLNLSILDGWWAEGYNGANGWAIDAGQEEFESEWAQDTAEAEALYNLLEDEVAPLFYKRDADDVPRGWVRVMKESIRTAAPVFCTRRMVKEYAERFYVPAMRRAQK